MSPLTTIVATWPGESCSLPPVVTYSVASPIVTRASPKAPPSTSTFDTTSPVGAATNVTPVEVAIATLGASWTVRPASRPSAIAASMLAFSSAPPTPATIVPPVMSLSRSS